MLGSSFIRTTVAVAAALAAMSASAAEYPIGKQQIQAAWKSARCTCSRSRWTRKG